MSVFLDLAVKLSKHVCNLRSDAILESDLDGKIVKDVLNEYITELGENILIADTLQWQSNTKSSFIGQYTHFNNEIGVLVEVDFGEQEADHDLIKDIAMQIAAMPTVQAIDESGIDQAYLDKEKAIFMDQAQESGKPANIIEKMVEGRLSKLKKEICLLSQPFVKDDTMTIADLLKSKSSTGTIAIKRFYRSSTK